MPSQVELAPLSARALPHAPSAALTADAGTLALAVARVWPRPHTAYFNAEAPRRRVAAFVASRLGAGAPRSLAEPLETWSLRRIVSSYTPDVPAGFVEALRRVDETGWSQDDFARLIRLLNEPEAAKVLRHAERITRAFLRVVEALPTALRRVRIVAQTPTPSVADLVARGARRACGRDESALARLAERMERARSPHALIRMLIDAIGLEQLAPPPIPGTDWFIPLATVGQISNAAHRFENCLKGRIPLLLRGKAAYYEVATDEPAIVEIVRDVEGLWVVGEVRGHANANISLDLWMRIRAHLELHGARVRGAKPDALALALVNAAGW